MIESELYEDYLVIRIDGKVIGAIYNDMDSNEFVDDVLYSLGYKWGPHGEIYRREST